MTLTFQEHHLETDGFRIKYLEAGPAGPVGTVVVLEGITWGISKLQDALAEMYRIIVLELPGFGTSPANTRSSSARSLAETANRATAEIVPEKYTLIGTSFSANVALWHALRAPDRVEALVLVSPTALRPLGNPADPAQRLLAHPENATDLPKIDADIVAKERELVHRLGGDSHDAEAESRLGEIQCPALVVVGSRDRLVAGEAAGIYRRDIPNCNVSIVYDAGHLIVAERPQALINVVVDYVERRETFIVSRESSLINP